jgi:hypothetical protein
MSSRDYLPAKDAELQAWATNFSARLTATPVAFGLVAADAAGVAALVTGFNSTLAGAKGPNTRTPVAVALKDTTRRQLVVMIRSLVRRIQATANVTASQKAELGITMRDEVMTPVPAPTTAPLVNLMDMLPRMHRIRLADAATPNKRARPDGVAGAEVYVFVGATPPADLKDWQFKGLATRSEFEVAYEADDVGKQASIVARWVNRKGNRGPASAPITGTVAA